MNVELLYWHWLVLGTVLTIAEIFLASFAILWFGLGAFIVGLLLLIFPSLPLAWQILIWTLISATTAILWFRYFRPLMVDRTKAGISREAAVGEIGLVIKDPADEKRGVVRFTTPLLGDDEWPFICEQEVATGDRVRVSDVSGNTLIVVKQTSGA